jgi:hypothetical protein
MIPDPVSCDTDALACTVACYEGTCTDDAKCQFKNVSHVMLFCAIQAASCPCPTPCPDKAAEFKRFALMHKTGNQTFDWAAILAALAPILAAIIQALIGGITPPA